MFERAKRHKDERKIKDCGTMLAKANADFDAMLPPHTTDEQRKMIFGTLKSMNDAGLLSEKFMNCAHALDKLFPGFSKPYEHQKESADKARAKERAEREAKEAVNRQAAEAELRQAVSASDIEEFGQMQAEHIAKWVIGEKSKGRPQTEIDKAVEEYRQQQRVKACYWADHHPQKLESATHGAIIGSEHRLV